MIIQEPAFPATLTQPTTGNETGKCKPNKSSTKCSGAAGFTMSVWLHHILYEKDGWE